MTRYGPSQEPWAQRRQVGIYIAQYPDETSTLNGIEHQRNYALVLAELKGWTVQQEYLDGAHGKETATQSALTRLLRDVQASVIDAVIVWSLDRFGQSIHSVLAIIEELHQADVALVVWREGIDTTTHTGQAVMNTFSMLTAIEKRNTQNPTAQAPKQRQVVSGATGKIPYGYRRVYDAQTGALKTIELAPKQAAIVREIFRLREQGHTLEMIVQAIRPKGNSPRGGSWTPTAVSRILNNKAKYAGGPRGTSGEQWPAIIEEEDAKFM